MKKQKRGKCKLWQSFTNIFRRRRSTDVTEVPQAPFSTEANDFPPLDYNLTKENNQPTKQTEVLKKMPDDVAFPDKRPSTDKPGQKTAGHKSDRDLDAVGREAGLVNTDFAKDKLKIKPKNRVPGKYNQMPGLGNDSLDRSLEDLVTVHTESNEGSQNSLVDSRDDNSDVTPDRAFGYALRNNSGSNDGEISSGVEAAEKSAKVALLPKKPLPKEPEKKKKDVEKEEHTAFRRIPSKKKPASSTSDKVKKSEANSNGIEKPVDPETVNLSISKSRNSMNEFESETKVTIERIKISESSTSISKPETKLMSKKTASGDSRSRLSVSMKETRRLPEKDTQPKAESANAENKSKAFTVESSNLSSSVKEGKFASKDTQPKAESANAESKSKAFRVESSNLSSSVKEGKFASKAPAEDKPEASEAKSSTLESKPKACKLETMLPQQGSLQKVSKTGKDVKNTHDDSKYEKTENNLPDKGEENSFKRPQRKPSKYKADGKKVESGNEDKAVPLGESSFKQNDTKRNSVKYSGQKIQEPHQIDASLTAKNSAMADSKRKTENNKETAKKPDPATDTSVITSVTNLSERRELLIKRVSGEQKEAQKASDRSSTDLRTSILRDLDKGSNLIEGQSLTDGQVSVRTSLADSREMLNRESQEDISDMKKEKKNHQQLNGNSSSRKTDFVSPFISAKDPQKGRDVRNSIHKDTVPEPEIRRPLPPAKNVNDEVSKPKNKMTEEGSVKELNKVFQKKQKTPSSEAGSESTTTLTEASHATKPENKSDAGTSSATETAGSIQSTKSVPVPPKIFRGDASRKDLGSNQKRSSQHGLSSDAKTPASANQSANLSSSISSHSRNASVTSGECKIPSENAVAEKSTGDVASSNVTSAGSAVTAAGSAVTAAGSAVTPAGSVVTKPKCPPPVVSRAAKVQPKAVENVKEADAAWIGKANRMSKDFSDKMLQKIEIKVEEKKHDAEIENNDNFERGGTRSSVKDMIKKLQKQNQAS